MEISCRHRTLSHWHSWVGCFRHRGMEGGSPNGSTEDLLEQFCQCFILWGLRSWFGFMVFFILPNHLRMYHLIRISLISN